MRKNVLFPAMIVLIIITGTIFISDGLTYLVAALMAFAIVGTIYSNRSKVMKITRWGKSNPYTAQVLITVLQIALMALGIIAGYNFKKLGYEFSNSTAYVFSTIIVGGFLSVPFLPKRRTIAIPRVVYRHRLAYMAIALSSFVMMAVFGNRLEDMYPNSFITKIVISFDHSIFPDDINSNADDLVYKLVSSEYNDQVLTDPISNMAVFASSTNYEGGTIEPSILSKKEKRENLKTEKKAKKLERKKRKLINLVLQKRLGFAGAISAGAVVLIILLVLTLCSGICAIILGGTVGTVLLGILITAASIYGIVKVANGSKKPRKKEL